MSPVTGLSRLTRRILWCVHMGNFSPIDRDEFKKHNQNGRTYKICIVCDGHGFVDSCNFTNEASLFFFYKNIFYKNIEAEICEILRIF